MLLSFFGKPIYIYMQIFRQHLSIINEMGERGKGKGVYGTYTPKGLHIHHSLSGVRLVR